MRPGIVHLERHAMAELPAQRSLQSVVIRARDARYLIRVIRRGVVDGVEREQAELCANIQVRALNGFKRGRNGRPIAATISIVGIGTRIVWVGLKALLERWISAKRAQLPHQRRNRSIPVNYTQ